MLFCISPLSICSYTHLNSIGFLQLIVRIYFMTYIEHAQMENAGLSVCAKSISSLEIIMLLQVEKPAEWNRLLV